MTNIKPKLEHNNIDFQQDELHSNLHYTNPPFNNEEEAFIELYLQTNSLQKVMQMFNPSEGTIIDLFRRADIQDEIIRRRKKINQSIYEEKYLSIKQVASFISNMLLDENVSDSNKLSAREKLDAAKLLIDINTKIQEIDAIPTTVNHLSLLESRIMSMSITDIKYLLSNEQQQILPPVIPPEDKNLIYEEDIKKAKRDAKKPNVRAQKLKSNIKTSKSKTS